MTNFMPTRFFQAPNYGSLEKLSISLYMERDTSALQKTTFRNYVLGTSGDNNS